MQLVFIQLLIIVLKLAHLTFLIIVVVVLLLGPLSLHLLLLAVRLVFLVVLLPFPFVAFTVVHLVLTAFNHLDHINLKD